MCFRGTSIFVIAAWLSGSACRVYRGDSLENEHERAQPATTAIAPRDFRNFELPQFPASRIKFVPRPDDAGAPTNPSAEPPRAPRASKAPETPKTPANQNPAEPPVAGMQAPSDDQAHDNEQDRRNDETEKSDDDAGVAPERSMPSAETDAGARDADAGMQQRIATGRSQVVDAGRPRPVAKASATCRGEPGFETDGRCYFVLDTPVSWNVGRDRCYEHDAHLASVTSEHESDFVASLDLSDNVWIGFSRFGAANFSWLSNESGSFSNWQKGAPRAMQESGALILASTGLWTNRAVPELHPALCETERETDHRRH